MSSTFSGDDVMTVLVNVGNFYVSNVRGDDFVLKWEPPADHENTDSRTVTVPRHDEISEGTLKNIGEQAGMDDFQRFKAWIDRNR